MVVLQHYALLIMDMKANLSRLTSKYQATVPGPVREKLRLKAGDTLSFEITEAGVLLRKATPLDMEFARALGGTLSEWSSAADEDAYRDL